jgi:hypothetical protein
VACTTIHVTILIYFIFGLLLLCPLNIIVFHCSRIVSVIFLCVSSIKIAAYCDGTLSNTLDKYQYFGDILFIILHCDTFWKQILFSCTRLCTVYFSKCTSGYNFRINLERSWTADLKMQNILWYIVVNVRILCDYFSYQYIPKTKP